MNLLTETRNHLDHDGYKWPDDVLSIQNREGTLRISTGRFIELADREYDNGYGGVEVAADLVVVMRDGSWYERRSYDGADYWTHVGAPSVRDRLDDDKVVRLMTDPGRLRSLYLDSDLAMLQYDKERAEAVYDFRDQMDDQELPVEECLRNLAEAVAFRQEVFMGNYGGAKAIRALSDDKLMSLFGRAEEDESPDRLYGALMALAEKHKEETNG